MQMVLAVTHLLFYLMNPFFFPAHLPTETNSCANIQVIGQSQGHTDIVVTYRYLDVKLEATVTVAVYRPLIV
jgi:Na+-transporting methylmalonyl-CoA/oxaloacetate decarboxylase beta subunit